MSAATPSPQRHPVADLLQRYKAVFQYAWEHRAELAGPKRFADEAAFLPAAISLQETPVHPAARRLAWAVMIFFMLALLWSVFGRVDIVAVAPGRVVVSDHTKVIQPLEASVVRRILVKDGDRVKSGQVLVELDPTMASADKSSIEEQLRAALSEEQRSGALLKALQEDAALIDRRAVDGDVPRAQLLAEWREIKAKLARLDAEIATRHAEMNTVKASIAKLEATVPMAQAREADYRKLVQQGYISGHATQDKTRERVELERDLATQRARLAEAQAALMQSEHGKTAYRTETLRLLSERHTNAATKRQQLLAERSKATQREELTRLTAPVDGVVQQLSVHTTGGVVTSAQPLMIVVPDAAQVTVEVNIANQDIGFVNAGQVAEVKFETFPYTRYGTVSAKVELVTADAVTDEKKGSYFPATLTLDRRDMQIDGKRVPLTPGMNVTAEIKTGQRRVIEYLLSPVQKAGNESLRER